MKSDLCTEQCVFLLIYVEDYLGGNELNFNTFIEQVFRLSNLNVYLGSCVFN